VRVCPTAFHDYRAPTAAKQLSASPYLSIHSQGDSDVVLRPHNGDRIVTIDSMTSLHPMYTIALCIINHAGRRGHWRGWGVQLRLSVCLPRL